MLILRQLKTLLSRFGLLQDQIISKYFIARSKEEKIKIISLNFTISIQWRKGYLMAAAGFSL
jgi:hypothetical protein